MMLYHSVIFRISAATFHNYTIVSYCTFFPVILYAMIGAELFYVNLCWCGSTHTNYNLVSSSGLNLELSPLSLLSILFHNLACSYNTEMTRSLTHYNVWWEPSGTSAQEKNSPELVSDYGAKTAHFLRPRCIGTIRARSCLLINE
jgi:hypothetical protein